MESSRSETAEIAPPTPAAQRIVSLSGTITEVLFDLGVGDRVVGVDVTSTYPADKLEVTPRLGHVSQLNVEALLALKPDLVLAEADNPQVAEALEQVDAAGIHVVHVPQGTHLSNAADVADALASSTGFTNQQLDGLRNRLRIDSLALAHYLAQQSTTAPRTLFLYARGPGRILVGGKGTGAEAMILHAGGVNVAQVDQFATLTPESVVAADPEVLLLFESGLASLDGASGLASVPGLATTSAVRNNRVVAMDGHYLLGFGPRAARAALDLARQLRGESTIPGQDHSLSAVE